jgi:hypothetical protein
MYRIMVATLLLALTPIGPVISQETKNQDRSRRENRAANQVAIASTCQGGFVYGSNETVTVYTGADQKRYRLSMWWFATNTWMPSRDKSGVRDSGAKLGLDGSAPILVLPYAPASMDAEGRNLSVLLPTAPTGNPQMAVCFEALP